MKLLYVAGPYRSKDGMWGVHQNIQRAKEVAANLWRMGFAVICPHANTAFMDGLGTDEMFLNGDLEMVKRCDGVVMLSGWEESTGATKERQFAKDLGMPVFDMSEDAEMLGRWGSR